MALSPLVRAAHQVCILVFVLVFPSCAIISALALQGAHVGLLYVADALLLLAGWLNTHCLAALQPTFEAALRGIKVALEWRALMQTHAPLLFVVLPACVWLGLRMWLQPEQARQAYRTVRSLVSGRGHQSRYIARMLLRRPVPQHVPEEGDTCPICIDALDEGDLLYCRWGCGRAVHAECMSSWRSHRNAVGMTECLVCKAWM